MNRLLLAGIIELIKTVRNKLLPLPVEVSNDSIKGQFNNKEEKRRGSDKAGCSSEAIYKHISYYGRRKETMRNVKKHIDAYRKKFIQKENYSQMADFSSTEYKELLEMSKNEFELVDNAVLFGFMVGYKYGKKEMKGKKNK